MLAQWHRCGVFIPSFHTLSIFLFLTYTNTHMHIFPDVSLGIKPLLWFYSIAETSCRLSFPGSLSGTDMDTHVHAHRQLFKCTLTQAVIHTNSLFHPLTTDAHTNWIISALTDLSLSIYSSTCSMTHPTVLLYQRLFWLNEVLLTTGLSPLRRLSILPVCVEWKSGQTLDIFCPPL